MVEIRVHGNHATPDADILAISGLRTGDPASDERLRAAEQALKESGRFDGAQVLKRFRSLDNPADILVMILVEERPAVTPEDLTPGPFRRLRAGQQWLPILNYADGYGFTYGVRTSFRGIAGSRSRLSVPLSWGGERRAAAELERPFERGPVSVVRGALAINRRVNPHYEQADMRTGLRLEAERRLTSWLRAGGDGRLERVDFGGADARHSAVGRPSDAGHADRPVVSAERGVGARRAGNAWRSRPAMPIASCSTRAATWAWGAPACWRCARRRRGPGRRCRRPNSRCSAAAPRCAGTAPGHRAGDSLAAVSAELRVPINPPLSIGRFGVKGFVDAGTVWSSGTRLSEQPWDRGIGGGVYLGAAVFMLDVDVAWPEEGSARAHVSLGVSF